MFLPGLWLSLVITGQVPKIEPGHEANLPYRSLLDEGATLDGKRVAFTPPLLQDGQPAAAQQGALRTLAGSDRAVADLLRDSVSAPFILKLKDEETPASVIRRADLWFAVRADLDAIDPDAMARSASGGKPVEVGNMRFTSRFLDSSELAASKVEVPKEGGAAKTWFILQTGRLLDRIHVQMTNEVVATRSPGSWVVATRTDPRFGEASALTSRWWPIVRKGSREEPGQPRPFGGGASYVKISRFAADPKVLLVEGHFAFVEPRPWFDGAPILRSKFSLIAQDQIRQLRRDLARRAARPAAKKAGG